MTKAETDAHLRNFSPEQRKVLQTLREDIAAQLPGAKEVIKYGIPTFELDGVPIIGFSGFKKHNSIFPYSGAIATRLKDELAGYEGTKGSIHFAVDKPFPKSLLKKVLKAKFQQLKEG